MNNILEKLKTEVPEFYLYQEFCDVLTIDFDRLGHYINELILQMFENKKIQNELVLKKVFDFLNELFTPDKKEIYNLISVSIFEVLIETKYCYDVAEKYMNKEMHQYFLKEYPIEEYKNAWNTTNYYTEEEYKRIINLPDVDDDDQ